MAKSTDPLHQSEPVWTVEWVRYAREIHTELWNACFPPPLEGLWWYTALEDSGLEEQFEFSYAILKKNGTPAGIAPAFIFNVPIDLIAPPLLTRILHRAGRLAARFRVQRTLFVGSPCSDEGTVGLVNPTDFAAAASALQTALKPAARAVGAPMIVWKDFPDEFHGAFAPMVSAGRLFRAVSFPGTRIALPGPDFAAFMKSISGSHRHQLKKKLARSRSMGPLDLTVIRRPDFETREEIFSLFWQTYEKGKTKFEVLNRDFFYHIAEHEGSHFILLRHPATEKLVAFMLCFRIGRRVINKFIGIDYAYGGNWYLYFRLLEAAIGWASELGATDFQSGQTGYRAKLDVGHTLVPLTNYCRHRNPLMNAIFSRIARGIDWSSLDDDLKTWVTAHPGAQPSSKPDARPA